MGTPPGHGCVRWARQTASTSAAASLHRRTHAGATAAASAPTAHEGRADLARSRPRENPSGYSRPLHGVWRSRCASTLRPAWHSHALLCFACRTHLVDVDPSLPLRFLHATFAPHGILTGNILSL